MERRSGVSRMGDPGLQHGAVGDGLKRREVRFERLAALRGEGRPGDPMPVGVSGELVDVDVVALGQCVEMARAHGVAQSEGVADVGEAHLLDRGEHAADPQARGLVDDGVESWGDSVFLRDHHLPRLRVWTKYRSYP